MKTTYTLTSATATTTSTVALAANQSRKYLHIQNNGSVTVYVKFGSVHAGTEGITLVAGASFEPRVPTTQSIFLKSASSTAAVEIHSGN